MLVNEAQLRLHEWSVQNFGSQMERERSFHSQEEAVRSAVDHSGVARLPIQYASQKREKGSHPRE